MSKRILECKLCLGHFINNVHNQHIYDNGTHWNHLRRIPTDITYSLLSTDGYISYGGRPAHCIGQPML